jgi:prevent-host-death family protein
VPVARAVASVHVDEGRNLTYYGLVKTIKISDFKKHISEELRRVRNGDRVVILDRDKPVAEVIPYGQSSRRLVVRPPRGPRSLPAVKFKTSVDPLTFLLEDRGRR